MPTKTITISQEAYNALLSERKNNENISDTIMRLTKNVKSANYFGKRKIRGTQEMPREFSDGWFTGQDLL